MEQKNKQKWGRLWEEASMRAKVDELNRANRIEFLTAMRRGK